jgi:hypothetical protein
MQRNYGNTTYLLLFYQDNTLRLKIISGYPKKKTGK